MKLGAGVAANEKSVNVVRLESENFIVSGSDSKGSRKVGHRAFRGVDRE